VPTAAFYHDAGFEKPAQGGPPEKVSLNHPAKAEL